MNKPTMTAILLSSLISAPLVFAQSASSVAPDNAKNNKGYSSNAATADAQPNNATDLGSHQAHTPKCHG